MSRRRGGRLHFPADLGTSGSYSSAYVKRGELEAGLYEGFIENPVLPLLELVLERERDMLRQNCFPKEERAGLGSREDKPSSFLPHHLIQPSLPSWEQSLREQLHKAVVRTSLSGKLATPMNRK